MDMNAEQDNFQNLRRLLTLKRYEQPPPRFFDQFSQQVILQIQAGGRIQQVSFWDSLSWDAPWLQRLWNAIETRPVLAGSFGVAICAFLTAGMLYSEPKDMPASQNLATIAGRQFSLDPSAQTPPANPLVQRALAAPLPGMQGFTANPESDSSIFQQFNAQQTPRVDLMNFAVPR